MTTAFQIGGFQFTGFQEGLKAGGGGGWLPHLLAMRAQRAKLVAEREAERKKKKKREPETVELSFRALPPAPVMQPTTTLEKFIINMERTRLIEELDEFREFMMMIAEAEEA